MTLSPCLLSFFILLLLSLPALAVDNDIPAQLRRLATVRVVGAETLHNPSTLARFYQERDYQPAWSDALQLLVTADELIADLPTVAVEGLDPGTYHLPALLDRARRFRAQPTPALAVELDLLLSDAFMSLATDSLSGRIAPASVDEEWKIPREDADPMRMLKQALASGRIRDSLHALLPQDPAYVALRNARQEYLRLTAAGGWPRLQLKSSLRRNAVGPEVAALRQRLAMTGDLLPAVGSVGNFDSELEEGVQHFQGRHGLTKDGVVGPATLAALNVPAVLRARQLALNLERWRWLPRSFAARYLRINLPSFHLELIEGNTTVLTMRVIVGRQLRQTPSFVGEITYLVLNPYWEVPKRLAVVDLLPKIQADRGYLEKEGIEVSFPGGPPLAAASLDWSRFNTENFPYHLRQRPGPKNALGRIKFIFPNADNIYLHDTPARQLFDREQRSFSSGCIRIEKPFALAEKLLQGTALAAPAALEEALKSASNKVVPLPRPLPVYILYWTAWADADGTVNFRRDLYQRDQRLDLSLQKTTALRSAPPS